MSSCAASGPPRRTRSSAAPLRCASLFPLCVLPPPRNASSPSNPSPPPSSNQPRAQPRRQELEGDLLLPALPHGRAVPAPLAKGAQARPGEGPLDAGGGRPGARAGGHARHQEVVPHCAAPGGPAGEAVPGALVQPPGPCHQAHAVVRSVFCPLHPPHKKSL